VAVCTTGSNPDHSANRLPFQPTICPTFIGAVESAQCSTVADTVGSTNSATDAAAKCNSYIAADGPANLSTTELTDHATDITAFFPTKLPAKYAAYRATQRRANCAA
jgi:hypothetical protein